MRHILKVVLSSLLCITILSYCNQNRSISNNHVESCSDCDSCCLNPCDGYPFFQIRSQGRNTARHMVGVQEFTHQHDMQSMNGFISLAVEYTKTLWAEKIAQFYFGKDLVNCNQLIIQGSDVENRYCRAWLADYFGLPTDYQSSVTFCPKIQNVIVDLDFHLGLDELAEGVYFKMNMPIVWSKWELCMSERRTSTGQNNFLAGYMSEDELPRDTLSKSFSHVMAGDVTFGDMKTSLKYGLINKGCHTKTGIAEISFTLGWDFIQEQDHHLGAFLCVAAPTGTKPCAIHLFEPIIGNGKHWELGGGLCGSWISWRSKKKQDHYLGVYMEAVVSHLFRTCQCRSFDFCNKPNSRYMLLAQMGSNDDAIKFGENTQNLTETTYQYKRNLIPAINWSTFSVDVKIDVQADIAIKLGYTNKNFSFDLGYNFYARTGERFCYNDSNSYCDDWTYSVCPVNCKPACKYNYNNLPVKYAIKGDSYMYGKEDVNQDPETYPIAFSQINANIYKGIHIQEELKTNSLNDNTALAWSAYNENLLSLTSNSQMFTSEVPIFVTRDMLNIGKSPSVITHKIFTHIGYAWKKRQCNISPFIGIGGEFEFAHETNCYWDECYDKCYLTHVIDCTNKSSLTTKSIRDCKESYCGNTCCDSICREYCNGCNSSRKGLSLWGIWIKGGIYFH